MTDFLKEPVLKALSQAGRPLKSKELARVLDVPTQDYRAFKAFLRTLTDDGVIYRVKGSRYAPPDKINLVVGHVALIRSGSAYILPEKAVGGDDVFVPADDLGNAFHGDKVAVRVERHRRGAPRAVWSGYWNVPAPSSWGR